MAAVASREDMAALDTSLEGTGGEVSSLDVVGHGKSAGGEEGKSLDGNEELRPGHHTFAIVNGDINKSSGDNARIRFMFHGVEKGTEHSWDQRAWFTGSSVRWSQTTYSRMNVPENSTNVGYSFKLFV